MQQPLAACDSSSRVKMEVDKAINQIKSRQETGLGNVEIRDLTILKKDLLNAIKNEPYKRALNQYAGDSAAISAIDDGFENGLKKMDPRPSKQPLRGWASQRLTCGALASPARS
jgi:hypothetical protein